MKLKYPKPRNYDTVKCIAGSVLMIVSMYIMVACAHCM